MAYCLTVETSDGSIALYGALEATEAYSVGRSAIDRGGDVLDVCCSKADDEVVRPDDIMGSWLWRRWYWTFGIVNRGE
jgi:hypothetical protein